MVQDRPSRIAAPFAEPAPIETAADDIPAAPPPDPPPATATVLTTRSVPQSQRLDYWQAICRGRIGTVECRGTEGTDFQASIEISSVADLKLARFHGVRQSLDRERRLISSADTDDYVALLMSNDTFCFDHNGRTYRGSGEIMICDITVPYLSRHIDRLDVTNISIPRERLDAMLGDSRRAAGLAIGRAHASFPLLEAFLRALVAHGPELEPAAAARMSSIAIDLIAAGAAERMGHEPALNRSATLILYRARAYIDAHLSEMGLGMGEVAAALGLSVRRLQQVAEAEGTSLSDWMWERRLARARAMLADPAHRLSSVSSLAYACGFACNAHFSRRFKARFGQTPTEYRDQHG